MKKLLLLIIVSLMLGGAAQAAKIVHLDATNPYSVIADESGVTSWLDMSGAGNDAVTDIGTVGYPSPYVSPGGFAGVDFFADRNRMELLTSLETDALFDFTGSATGGFAVFIVVQDDPDTVKVGQTDPIGTNSVINNAGFGLRGKDVQMAAYLVNSAGVGVSIGENNILNEGETYIHAMHYDAATGAVTVYFLTSDGDELTEGDVLAAADFSNANSLWLGSTVNANRYLKGSLGEVIIYDELLSAADFAYQTDVLARKWIESRAVNPIDGDPVGEATTVQLEWDNLLPDTEGEAVYVDVWFGTDPNSGAYTKVVDAELNETTVIVNTPSLGMYYWQVDTYAYGDPDVVDYDTTPADPNAIAIPVIEGPIYSFEMLADMPPSVVIDTTTTVTWKNVPIQLNSTVTDDGVTPVDFLWEADDPNAVFSPSATDEDPTVTVDYASGLFNVTVTVGDGTYPDADSASVELDCRQDACAASRLGLGLDIGADIDEDCAVGLPDIVLLAAKWVSEYAAPAPFITPQ